MFGSANCVVLSTLKNSARSSTAPPSPSLFSVVRFMSARSRLRWPGPVTIPTPLLPKPVALPSAPITGQVALPEALRAMQLLLK